MEMERGNLTPAGGGIFEGKILLAMPGLNENDAFERSVIYICAHSEEGAMGVIINQSMPMIEFDDLLDQIGLPQSEIIARPDILFGGPVETSRGFVLHSSDYMEETSVPIADKLALNATTRILKRIATGEGPRKSLLVLGYAGWGPGQLEEEVQENSWLSLDADENLLFDTEITSKWGAGLNRLGIAPEHLTSFGGKA